MGKNLNLNMKSNELTQITNANIFKRIIAFIMDGALFAFIMFGLIAACFYPISNKSFKYSQNRADLMLYQVSSKLVVCKGKDENGNEKFFDLSELDQAPSDATYPSIGEVNGQEDEFYINRVKYYYLNYKTGVNVEYPASANPEDYKAPNYQELIDGKARSEYYTEEWFLKKVEDSQNKVATLISDAISDLCNEEFYATKETKVRLTGYFLVLPPFFISFSIFFIIIPLIFKNGETLGKKSLHLSFINIKNYAVRKRQIVYRQFFLLILTSILCFVIGRIGVGSLAFLGIGIVVYYVATILSKQKRSLADFLAMTLLVDANKSVWFENATVEQEKEDTFQKNMEQYHENNTLDSHVIQVGGTIVNEDVKREVEEENKEQNNKL